MDATLPFGFKNSAYIYTKIGFCLSTWLKDRGIQTEVWIDDRFIGECRQSPAAPGIGGRQERRSRALAPGVCSPEIKGPADGGPTGRAGRALYAVLFMQSYLGYFINLKKSHLRPATSMIHLGMGICSETLSFCIPDTKKQSFFLVRESILSEGKVTLKQMQRFVGKCQSFILAFPAASLYIMECCAFMPNLDEELSTPLSGRVQDEIASWRSVDSVSQPISWRQEQHLALTLSSDASGRRWGSDGGSFW